MSYQPSEIATLILFLAFGPVIIVALRRTLHPVPGSCYIALGAMFGAYVFTVAEGFVLPELLNLLEHVCYAVAGVTFALMLLEFRRVSPQSRHPR